MTCAGATDEMWVIAYVHTDWATYATVDIDIAGQTSCIHFMRTNCLQQIFTSFLVLILKEDPTYGKRGANVTRQLKSFYWIGSSDSFYNPNGQVFPWQQLALSLAGKVYKQMLTWV